MENSGGKYTSGRHTFSQEGNRYMLCIHHWSPGDGRDEVLVALWDKDGNQENLWEGTLNDLCLSLGATCTSRE